MRAERVLGVFGGPRYRWTYPNGDRVEGLVEALGIEAEGPVESQAAPLRIGPGRLEVERRVHRRDVDAHSLLARSWKFCRARGQPCKVSVQADRLPLPRAGGIPAAGAECPATGTRIRITSTGQTEQQRRGEQDTQYPAAPSGPAIEQSILASRTRRVVQVWSRKTRSHIAPRCRTGS